MARGLHHTPSIRKTFEEEYYVYGKSAFDS